MKESALHTFLRESYRAEWQKQKDRRQRVNEALHELQLAREARDLGDHRLGVIIGLMKAEGLDCGRMVEAMPPDFWGQPEKPDDGRNPIAELASAEALTR